MSWHPTPDIDIPELRPCPHEFAEREAAIADGMCPQCAFESLLAAAEECETAKQQSAAWKEAWEQQLRETARLASEISAVHAERVALESRLALAEEIVALAKHHVNVPAEERDWVGLCIALSTYEGKSE